MFWKQRSLFEYCLAVRLMLPEALGFVNTSFLNLFMLHLLTIAYGVADLALSVGCSARCCPGCRCSLSRALALFGLSRRCRGRFAYICLPKSRLPLADGDGPLSNFP